MAVTEPQILDVRRAAPDIHVRLRIPTDLHYLRGHFPGTPIVPGVVLLKWALDLARQELAPAPVFQRLSGVKFMRVMPLDTDVDLHLRAESGAIAFEYLEGQRSCVLGRAHFVAS